MFKKRLIHSLKVVIKTIVVEVEQITVIIKELVAKGQMSAEEKSRLIEKKNRLRILRPKLAKKKVLISQAKTYIKGLKDRLFKK